MHAPLLVPIKVLTLLEHARVHLGVRLHDGVAQRRMILRHRRGKNIHSAGFRHSIPFQACSPAASSSAAQRIGPIPDSQFPIPDSQCPQGFRV